VFCVITFALVLAPGWRDTDSKQEGNWMRKRLLLIALLALISSGCAYAYAARTLVECGGEQSLAWAEGMGSRLEELEADQRAADAVLQANTYLELDYPDDLIWLRHELQPYATRAEARYRQQISQTAPVCLREMQELMAEVFYTDWKIYEAVQHGDEERATELQDQSVAAMDAASREYERLVEKYHWEE